MTTTPARRRRRWMAAGTSLTAVATAALTTAALATPAVAATAGATPPPPPVTILTKGHPPTGDDYFVTPTGTNPSYSYGPEIVTSSGKKVWFHAIPAGQTAADFKVQRYDGQPVLTWWQGQGLGGLSTGTDYIYSTKGKLIASVRAGNGDTTDGHEFLITPQNTALVLSYDTATADLTSIGGPADQTVINGVVQEVDVATGAVLFQWQSDGSVPYGDSEQPLPASATTPWDWFHVNAVHLDTDGNLLIDGRDTWTTYKVNRANGSIIWRLGGKESTFKEVAANGQFLDGAGEIFAWQHDPEALGNNTYTVFDNDSTGTPELPYSRTVTVQLDPTTDTATLVSSNDQPLGLSAPSQGDAQTLADGDQVVGWGALPYFSEFSPTGALLLNAEFPSGVNTYRAYRYSWPPAA